MIINYFDQYEIDTSLLKEKLEAIQNSHTENASYLSQILLKALDYLFPKMQLSASHLYENLPPMEEKPDAIVFFQNEKTIPFETDVPVVCIGNGRTDLSDEKRVYLHIKDLRRLKIVLKKDARVLIGFRPEDIDFSKYYDTRMRIYFLNVLDMLDRMPLTYLKEDVEKACTFILLDRLRFVSPVKEEKGKISLKKMIQMYQEILSITRHFTFLEGKMMFYTKTDLKPKSIAMLNEMSLLAELFQMENKEERISRIYDMMCDRMLEEAHALGYCQFENNRCIASRNTNGFPNSKENGCCQNTYKDKNKNCRYLNGDHSCKICALSCRVFTCAYLQRRGIDHALYQYPLIDVTFGKLKKSNIVYSFFTPKEELMKALK